MDSHLTELQNYLVLGGLLFSIGLIGLLVRRNMIVMFLCVEMMLQGISVSLVAWGRFHGDWGGQMLVIFIVTVAACEAAIGLAMILAVFNYSKQLDIAFWQEVREAGIPPFTDHEIPEEREEDRVWPTLSPAGVEPELDVEEITHRSRV